MRESAQQDALPAAAGSGCRQATATAPTMRSIGVPLVVSAILPSAAIAVAPCPAGMTLMAEAVPWRGDTFTVCETAEPGGALHFLPGSSATTSRANAGGAPIVVSRTAKPLFNTTPTYANTSAAAVGNSSADVMGNALLARGVDPTLSELANVMRPLVLVGGYDFNDPIQCTTHGEPTGCKAYAFDGGVHTFIGSRGSSADIVFDTLGSDVMSEGHPSMNGFIHKYGLSNAIFKDKLDPMVVLEGLWGGYLPIISYWYKREAGGWSTLLRLSRTCRGRWSRTPTSACSGSRKTARSCARSTMRTTLTPPGRSKTRSKCQPAVGVPRFGWQRVHCSRSCITAVEQMQMHSRF
jgi:hypothetical protein